MLESKKTGGGESRDRERTKEEGNLLVDSEKQASRLYGQERTPSASVAL